MVRLKHNNLKFYFTGSTEFQSHNGSIKTQKEAEEKRRKQRFQSHNGSIKTRIATETVAIPL